MQDQTSSSSKTGVMMTRHPRSVRERYPRLPAWHPCKVGLNIRDIVDYMGRVYGYWPRTTTVHSWRVNGVPMLSDTTKVVKLRMILIEKGDGTRKDGWITLKNDLFEFIRVAFSLPTPANLKDDNYDKPSS